MINRAIPYGVKKLDLAMLGSKFMAIFVGAKNEQEIRQQEENWGHFWIVEWL